MYTYKAFGFQIVTDIELPQLSSEGCAFFDLKITEKSLPEHLENASRRKFFEWNEHQILFTLEGIGRILLEKFNVFYEKSIKSESNLLPWYLTGLAIAPLMYKNGILPLHAASLMFENQAIAISGTSGSGKSTLAASLLKNLGCELISDDISAIVKGQLMPGTSMLKLSETALKHFDFQNFTEIGLKDKFAVKFPLHTKLASLSKIIFLEISEGKTLEMRKILGQEKYLYLRKNCYRHQFANIFSNESLLFENINAMKSVETFLITRGESTSFDEVENLITKIITT